LVSNSSKAGEVEGEVEVGEEERDEATEDDRDDVIEIGLQKYKAVKQQPKFVIS
jgi:hypothetical protein